MIVMLFRRALLLTLYKLSDIVIALCSFALAIGVSGYDGLPSTLSHLLSGRITVLDPVVIVIATGIWHVVFRFLGLYETKRFGRRLEECIDVLKATSLGTCLISGFVSLLCAQAVNGSFIFVIGLSQGSVYGKAFWIRNPC